MPLCADAQGLDALVSRLDSASDYCATARYAVTMPQADDDVVYTLTLHQPQPLHYLIEWSVDTPSGPNSGFSAHMPGHFYAYRNGRLREYHTEWDSVPLLGPRAVQHTTQFAKLIPAELAHEIRLMAADTATYALTLGPGPTLTALRQANGMTDAEMSWRFDPDTGLQVEFTAEYNPGAISEQTVHATYSPAPPCIDGPLTEQWLRGHYARVFDSYRQSNFAVESMPGQQLPAFSLPLTFGADGARLSRRDSEPLNPDGLPTVVVLLDAEASLTPQLVAEVRRATAQVPVDVAVLYAFAGRNPELNRAALGGALRPDEQAVSGARRLLTDCGAASLPVVMLCDPAATVRNVTVGLNNHMAADVMKMITLSSTSH